MDHLGSRIDILKSIYVCIYVQNYLYIYMHIYIYTHVVMLNLSQHAEVRGFSKVFLAPKYDNTPLVITGHHHLIFGASNSEGLCLAIIDLLDDTNAGEGLLRSGGCVFFEMVRNG